MVIIGEREKEAVQENVMLEFKKEEMLLSGKGES